MDSDPLFLLKDYVLNNKAVVLDGDSLVFGDRSFPKSTVTFWRPKGKQDDSANYRLDAIWFFLQHQDASHATYLVEANKQKYPIISLVDKKEILNFLTNPDAPLPFEGLPAPVKHTIPPTDEPPAKKQKSDPTSSSSAPSVSNEIVDPVELEEAKKQMAQRIEQSKVKPSTANIPTNIDPSGLGLSAARLMELKRKRNIKKRDTISSDEPTAVGRDNLFQAADIAVTKDIKGRERLLRTRTTILHAGNKKNFQNIITVVKGALKKEEAQKKADIAKQAEEQKKSQKYDRYEIPEEQFWKAKLKGNEAEELGIDTRGTFADGGLLNNTLNIASMSQPKPKPSSNSKPNSNQSRSYAPVPSEKQKAGTQPQNKEKDVSKIPIIIVPATPSASITLLNIKQFLEGSTYVSPKELSEQGVQKENTVTIMRNKSKTVQIPYLVVDNITRMSPKDWKRVVAVFAFGATWQFKGFPWGEKVVEIFSHTRGFYLRYDDEQPPQTIKDWDIKILKISKKNKHFDQTAALEFWNTLDQFIAKKADLQFLDT